ncbi:MAG: nitrilase-related carbon-nitrogen hydrolase, partial [SAR324 cluster bacterium]|nr:nitrilase-related carbon-nitrogen hydrolase [SAR324 cluster bacterium]
MTNPPSKLKVACVQLTSSIDLEYNRQQVEVALQEAVENGAQWIVLPEAVNLLQQKNPLARATAVSEAEDPVL